MAEFATVASAHNGARPPASAVPISRPVPTPVERLCTGNWRLIDDWLLAHGIAKNERISCNNWGAIAGMLVASVGVGILPEGWAKKLVRANLLRIVDDVHPLATLTYSFQWRRGDSRPLIDQMLPLAASLADFSADAQLPWLI